MQLQKEVKREPNAKISVRVTVYKAGVSESHDEIVKDFERHAKIPGFRKGRVPKNLVLTHYSKRIKEETISRVLSKSLEQILEEGDLKPISEPLIVEMGDLKPGEDFSFKAEFDVIPEIRLPEYRGIRAEKYEYEVSEERVIKEIELLRERFARLESKGGGAEPGDYVLIDYEEIGEDGRVRSKKKDQTVLLDDKEEELTKQLVGAQSGDEKKVTLTYKETGDGGEQEATVELRVQVKDVKIKVLPDLNDDFAKDISDVDSMEELKRKVLNELENETKRLSEEKTREEIVKNILEKTDIELPETMVSSETNRLLLTIVSAYRISLEKLQKDPKRYQEYRESLRPKAVRNVKYELVMNEIAREEKIDVTEQEVEEEIKKYAESGKKEFETVKRDMAENKSIDSLRHRIRQTKAMNLVYEHAQFGKAHKLMLEEKGGSD